MAREHANSSAYSPERKLNRGSTATSNTTVSIQRRWNFTHLSAKSETSRTLTVNRNMPGSPSVAKRDTRVVRELVGILQVPNLQALCRAPWSMRDRAMNDHSRALMETAAALPATVRFAGAHCIPLVWLGGLPIAAIDRVGSAEFMLNVALARRGAGGPPPLITSANGQVLSMCARDSARTRTVRSGRPDPCRRHAAGVRLTAALGRGAARACRHH